MDEIIIIPNKMLGKLELGMGRNEIETILYNDSILRICTQEEEKTFKEMETVKYYNKTSLMYVIGYKDNKAFEICLDSAISDIYNVMLKGINVFKEKAEDIISKLKTYSSYTCDTDDEDLGTEYDFNELGISLWRELAFHPKIMNNKEFLELSKENQEIEKKYWYFQMINVHKYPEWNEFLQSLLAD
ncbi:hypothetical protein Y919_09620 [Caloranaerobacter azorensis H53214]|uniref:Uncharacterized protein n=1 Tax=Caloranaerobacter azorensis H53214 TaxID=1156417 RepID=A0A096BF57_9FIRM|nr:hypothetical protein [Caloranaerobacter azorensis]KGG79830.1 hypothetical protein Y919_09620 [Caloranaerobacter azorensis H53214]